MATTVSSPVDDVAQVDGDENDAPSDASDPITDAPSDESSSTTSTVVDSAGSDGHEDGPSGQSTADAADHRRSLLVVAVAIVIVAATTWAAVLGLNHRDHVAAVDRHQSIVTAAHQVVTDLVTLRYGTADADVKRIKENATGDFLKQMGDTTGGFATVLKQGQVESTGHAAEVAVLTATESAATVIAAVTSTVRNSDAPQGQARVYRMKLSLIRQGDRWLASDVEFVS